MFGWQKAFCFNAGERTAVIWQDKELDKMLDMIRIKILAICMQ